MVILGLGSNQGDRLGHLSAAVVRLEKLLGSMRLSRVFESKAMLPDDAPAEWDRPFLNMAVSGSTQLSPQALLSELKKMERELGRITRGNWGPREIDIDILAMDNIILKSKTLTIPHPGLLLRDFALLPLIDVAPDWRYPAEPCAGMLAREIAIEKGYAPGPMLTDKGRLHAA